MSGEDRMKTRRGPRGSDLTRLLLACTAVLCWSAVFADVLGNPRFEIAARNVQFNQLTTNEGLSQHIVYDIVQDPRRFIWIATQEGLNRYDGYQVKTYEHFRADATTLSHDFVRTLMVDTEGTLWIGTESGVNRYDLNSDTIERNPFERMVGAALPRVSIRAMLQTKNGVYWIGTKAEGLYRIDPQQKRKQHFINSEGAAAWLPDDSVLSLLEDSKGNLWIGTEHAGLFRFDSITGQFVPQGSIEEDDPTFLGREIRQIFEDDSGFVWIGTANAGASRFDPRRGSFERFVHSHDSRTSLASNKVRDIVQDRRGTIWMATDVGLSEWRENEKGFATYLHDDRDKHSLIGNRLNVLFVDASGVLWVGSWQGISRWNYFSDTFTYYRKEDGLLPGNVVTSLVEAPDGTMWIATLGTGLAHLDPVRGTVRTFRNDPDDPGSLPDDKVMTVHVDDRGLVWVGTRNGGLARFNEDSGTFVRYQHDPEDPASLSGNAVSSLYSDSGGSLWVGTYGAGLNLLSPEGSGFRHFRHQPGVASSLSGDRVVIVTGDRAGRIWVGTDGDGLNRLDELEAGFKRFSRFSIRSEQDLTDVAEEFQLETVTDLVQDQHGDIWIGTLGSGLLQAREFNSEAGLINAKAFTKAEGLPTDTIYGVLQGQDAELWLSSNKGLTRLDPREGSVRQFDSRNGLREDEFNAGARLRSRGGRLLFGGPGGLVAFYPGELPVNQVEPGIVLSARSRENELVTTSSDEDANGVEISYIDKFIAFDFVGLDFMSPDKNQYRYILEGFDTDWVEVDEFRRAVYTNLPAGDYTFVVQAANNDGVWNERGASIDVRVIPAPWSTWWAYLAYCSGVIGAIGFYIRAQRRKLRMESHQRVKLEQEVSERTRELAQRNWELEKLNEKLAEASVTDSLTGLRNRRYVDQFINSEVSLFERSQVEGDGSSEGMGSRSSTRTMFFMMIDLDGFKLINDRFGHNAGDMALIQVKDILRDCTRSSDTLIRWGGDEFMVIGFSSGFSGVKVLAERIREAISAHRYDVGAGDHGRLSASIGIAPYPLIENRESFCGWELVAAIADQAAYIAKANGRDAWVSLCGSENLDTTMLERLKLELADFIDKGMITLDSSEQTELTLSGRNRIPLERAGTG